MKKLKTTDSGGFPLTLDDLRFLHTGTLESLRAICAPLLPTGAGSMILSGCSLTNMGQNSWYVSPGWVYLNSEGIEEICQVDGHYYTHDGSGGAMQPRWQPVTNIYDPEGNKVFMNGQTRQTYQIVKAQIVVTDDDALPLASETLPMCGEWITATPLNGFTLTPTRPLQYRRRLNVIEFRGAIDGLSGLVFNLPVGYRPTSFFEVVLQIMPTESPTCMKKLNINTTGQVSIVANEAVQTTIPMCFSVPV